ncbi:lipoprotein, partial [Spiroplasma phoeniceum]|uniref:lipoprotein n=1 Tax=Spiroplasma phoeniceum TaxID=47835 RepID=UPI003364DBDE
MKKILSIIGAISLVVTSTTSLVACNKPIVYTPEQLKELKEKNNIKTKDGILEWIVPQEKPFNQVDNKWYFMVWRGDKNDDWKIIKFNNNELKIGKIFDKYNQYTLELRQEMAWSNFDICVNYSGAWSPKYWGSDDGTRFKSVYRWNNESEPNTPFISPKTGQITDWNLKQQNNFNTNDEIKVTVKNKDISENSIYQLEANYFNWLSITNELETNNIPSLIPSEIKLSDG